MRGDLELCVVRFAPDYRYDPPREWLIAGMPNVYRGHAGLRRWADDLREAWEFLDHTPLEIVDAGNVVAFLCKIRLRARASGVELDSRLGQVFWIEQGLIVRESDFGDWGEALRAVGVSEEARGSIRGPVASRGNVQRFHQLRRRLSERRELSRDLLAEDAEWVNPDDAVEPGTRRGANSFLQAVASVFEGWQESVFEIEQVIDRGEDVIALGTLRARGRATGIEATIPHGEIWTFEEGKVARMCWFNTHSETLAAAGLGGSSGPLKQDAHADS